MERVDRAVWCGGTTTLEATLANPTGTDGPITEVHEGMTVLDSAGEKVGKVKAVRMGDPQAATAKGQESGFGHDILDHFAIAFETSSVPTGARERLARMGFLHVDAAGIFTGDRYVASDEIASVDGDEVHLSVPRDDLIG